MRASITLLLLLLLTAIAACSDPFREAAERDTAEAWRAYLASGQGGDAEQEHASERHDDLMWQEAEELDTIASYRRYLEALPNGRHSQAASARLESLRFARAMERGDSFSLEEFLSRHPRSRHADAARARLMVLRREEALEAGTIEVYEAFLRDFPNADGTDEVERGLEKLLYEQTIAEGSMDSVERLRRRFPDGLMSEQVEIHSRALRIRAFVLAGEKERAERIVAGSGQPAVREELSRLLLEARVDMASLRLDSSELRTLAGEGELSDETRQRALELADALDSRRDRDDLAAAAGRLLRSDPGLPATVIEAGLKDRDARRRMVSVRALGYSADPRAIGALASALRDRNLGVRAEAAEAIRRLGASLDPVVRDVYFTKALDRLDGVVADEGLVWVAAVLLEAAGLDERALAAYRRAAGAEEQVLARLWLARFEDDPHRRSVALTGAALWLRDALRFRHAAVMAFGRSGGAESDETMYDSSLLRQVNPLLEQLRVATDLALAEPEHELRFTWISEVRDLIGFFGMALADAEARGAMEDPEWIPYFVDEGSGAREDAAHQRQEAAALLRSALSELPAIAPILDHSARISLAIGAGPEALDDQEMDREP